MKLKILQTVTIAALTSVYLSGQQNSMDIILADTTLTGTSWSICFADAVTGEMIFGHDATRNLASASVMKLYPTSVALSLLGPDYRFSTEIFISGKFNSRRGIVDGDVVIRGNGDPALGSEYFAEHYGDVVGQWTKALLAAGIRHVKGGVAAAPSIYDFNPAPSGWSWGNLGQYYGAGVYDINFNDNKYNIFITGYSEGSPAVIDSVELYGRDVRLTNYLTSSGRSDRGYVYSTPYSHTAWIAGSVPADSSFVLKASNPDPPLTVVKLLDMTMRNAGIRIDGSPSEARITAQPEESKPLCVTLSPTLEEIVRVTNHESVNMYAEAIRKHLGYALLGEGTFSAGGEVIRSFLDSIGCDPSEAVILDGSGLSANNNISALMTVKLLVHMHNSVVTAPFIGSLPEGAVSGTMKSYFRDEFFRGRVFAKTGTISSAKSFAGYVTTGSGRRLAFTMFANGFTVSNRIITDYMESVVREIIENY